MNSLEASEALSARGATHARVSLEDMNNAIASEHFINAGDAVNELNKAVAIHLDVDGMRNPLGLMTICFLVCKNGFVVVGKSAPASPENFDPDKGRTFAREDAIRQLWPLMGFALRAKLAEAA